MLPGQSAIPHRPPYAVCVLVYDIGANDLSDLQSLGQRINAMLDGRKREFDSQGTPFWNEYVLNGYTTAEGGEFPLTVYIAMDARPGRIPAGAVARVNNFVASNPVAFRLIEFTDPAPGTPLSSQFIADYMTAQAVADGFDALWVVDIHTDMTGDLRTKFVLI